MKKLLVLLGATLALTGCASGVSQVYYDEAIAERNDYYAQLYTATDTITELRAEIATSNDEISELRDTLGATVRERNTAQTQLKNARGELAIARSSLRIANAHIEELEAREPEVIYETVTVEVEVPAPIAPINTEKYRLPSYLTLIEATDWWSYEYLWIAGTVRNVGSSARRFCDFVVRAYGADGNLLRQKDWYIDETNLGAGSTSAFDGYIEGPLSSYTLEFRC